MRRPWEPSPRPADDMEALQTDVMRFMAILGLCLAAIFSILKNPETPPPEHSVVEHREKSAPAPTRQVSRPEVETTTETTPAEPQAARESLTRQKEESEEGFSLEFSSADSLERLLTEGGVALYAFDGEHYWRWVATGVYQREASPDSYYVMQQATVPPQLRAGLPSRASGKSLAWGVVLNSTTARRISVLMQQRRGGSLLITADGSVHFGENN